MSILFKYVFSDRQNSRHRFRPYLRRYSCFPYPVGFGLGVRFLGPLFVLGFYFLLGLHVYAYFTVVLFVLRKRLGTVFGLLWVAIGLSLVYNVAFNHFFATFLKAGGPLDLKVRFSCF